MRNLYYGYMFQEDYNPYRQSVYADKVEEYIYKKDLTRDECDSLEHYANLSLQDNMFDFEQLEYFAYALKAKKKHARYEVFRKNIHLLLSAIMTSGRHQRAPLGGDLPDARIRHRELPRLQGCGP